MDEDLTLEEKQELSELLNKGFKLALKIESCFPKNLQIPVVITACAWILEKSRRVSPESVKEEFFGGVKHLMTVCGDCIEKFEDIFGENNGKDE